MKEGFIAELFNEVSCLASKEWNRLKVNGNDADQLSHTRLLFEAFIKISNDHRLPVSDTVEVIKFYLSRATWDGLLVRDCGLQEREKRDGEIWALVTRGGILASFGGSPFYAIYEPEYDIHDDKLRTTEKRPFYTGEYDDHNPALIEERKVRMDDEPENHVKTLFGIPYHDDDEDRGYIGTLPDGTKNPLLLVDFSNVSNGQQVVEVSKGLLQRHHVTSVDEWVRKRRNGRGQAASYDILRAAAFDVRQGVPIVRQLRSWTEDDYGSVREAVLTMASAWPKYLAGRLTFASSHHKSWIVIEQDSEKTTLFEKENWPINTALSRILAAITGMQAFRGMTCRFDLSQEGKVLYDAPSGKVIRSICDRMEPSSEENELAMERIATQLVHLGYGDEMIRSTICDPLQLGEVIDPSGLLLRKNRAHPEQRLFEMVVTISEMKRPAYRPEPPRGTSKDMLYNAIGGDGRESVYLSDGLWIAPDGSLSDEGR